jgi:Zn-dependent protease/predicted transcriptional regulator
MLGSGIRIGRLYGINIRIDWSWLFIFVLITWNLNVVFGQLHPDWGMGMRWGIAILASLLFFASVLAHEMAHSLVAKAHGLPVRNITLFLFGGVANIQREPESPRAEFLIAIAGPIMSVLIGVVMVGVAVITGLNGQPGASPAQLIAGLSPANTILLWLGSINIILAIFNMIPGFPLDGGRVLRSILWALTNNLRRATRIASWVGQAVAWMMIAAGIAMAFGFQIPLLGTGLISGLWLAFIGWFLNNASIQSYRQVAIKDILEGVPVTRLMRSDPPTVNPDCAVSDLVHTHVMGTDDQAFPVLESEQLVGIVTLDDVRRVPRSDWDTVYVRDIMTGKDNLVTINPENDAAEALEKLMQRDVRQLPVVRSNREFIGLLRRRDIMRWLQITSENAGEKGI